MQKWIVTLMAAFAFCNCLAQTQVSKKQSAFMKSAAPATAHYHQLGALSPKPDPQFAWMDSIVYPSKEHATSSLAATRLRTAYLVEDVPSLLQLPAPPANSSEQTRAELAFLRQLQAARTPESTQHYQRLAGIFHSPNNFNPHDRDYDRNFSSLFHVGSPLGAWYGYKRLPFTARFLSDVYRDATYYFFNLKLSVNRPRPYMLDTTLKNLERPQHASYPSGHSAASYVNAYIMAEIAPELEAAFLKMAAEMAYSREVLGVHYPSDSEAGRLWARRFVNVLFAMPAFRKDFEKAKAEILDLRKQQSLSGEKALPKQDCGHEEEAGCDSACCKKMP